MVKLRDARYCNLKLVLIFLVIYGHLIETGIWHSKMLMTQYKWIYLFHMPLFCFSSGLFMNDGRTCGYQFSKMLSLYMFLQTFAVLLGNGKVDPLTPYWHLWYLLSYSAWAGFGWLWFRFGNGRGKIVILACTILVGCLAGFNPEIGREHSLSRTLVFLPFFWMGLVCDPQFPWERLRRVSLVGLGIVFAAMARWGEQISVVFLYQAAPYGKQENGIVLRLLCYLLGTLLCLAVISFVPKKRFLFTRAGADTMPAYLVHAPIVLCIRELDITWQQYLLIAVVIIYAAYKLLRWHGRLYGIVQIERRDSWCPHFRESTKNTQSPFTDSCYP